MVPTLRYTSHSYARGTVIDKVVQAYNEVQTRLFKMYA